MTLALSTTPRSRWAVLGIYAWIAGLSQLLWLNFAPILSTVQSRYGVSENQASLLLLVFPFTYVLFSIHAGRLIDSKGYRHSIALGAFFMAAFSSLRTVPGNSWILLLAQTGISIGQPYIVNGVTQLVSDWFPASSAALATGLGTAGLFIGMAIGMAATPPLIDFIGFSGTMIFFALLSWISLGAFLFLCKPRSSLKTPGESTGIARDFWPHLQNRNLILLFLISFLGLGFFNGLTSWIEAILAPNGINSNQAGSVGGIMIFGGILGSILIPGISDRFKRRKPFLIFGILAAALTLIPLCRSTDFRLLLLMGFLQGFFFLPAYALLLDMTATEAGKKWSGSATGVLMLTGNAGGVLVILGMGWLKGDSTVFGSALSVLLGLLIAAAIAAFFTRDPRP